MSKGGGFGSSLMKTIENAPTALKIRAGGIEESVGQHWNTATGAIQGFIGQNEGEPHKVSDYHWKRALFKFRATLHHGSPGDPTTIAYEPIQKLLAVGTSKGLVKIFGKPSVEVVVNQYDGVISLLLFIANAGKLLIVYRGSSCELVNLDTKRSCGSHVFSGCEVTSLTQVGDTPFVFVGLSNGNVHVLSTQQKLALSTYKISGRSDLQVRQSTNAVIGIENHPLQSYIVLIAHEFDSIVEWDLNRNAVIQRYHMPGDLGTLNTIKWHPGGLKFAGGFKNGDVLVWRQSEPTPIKAYKMTNHPHVPRRPIKKLYWTKLDGRSFLCTLGGTSMSHEPATAVVRYMKHLTILPPKQPKIGVSVNANLGGKDFSTVIDIACCLPSHYPFSCNPTSIICLTPTADITVYAPVADGRIRCIPSPPSFQLQSSQVTCTLFCTVSKQFLHDLTQHGDISWRASQWPLLGGITSLQPLTNTDILLTGHADGHVFFWDMSNTHFNLLYKLNIYDNLNCQIAGSAIRAIDLCVDSRILAISCESGQTFVYHFSDRAIRLTQEQIEQATLNRHTSPQLQPNYNPLDRTPVGGAPTTTNNASHPPAQMARTISSNQMSTNNRSPSPASHQPEPVSSSTRSKKHSTTEKSSSSNSGEKKKKSSSKTSGTSSGSSSRSRDVSSNPKPSPSHTMDMDVSGAGESVFSWEKFFVNANVDPNAAANYAKFFVSEKITEDLVKDLDQDLMEMAGITTVGDKMRIMKYIKTAYSRDNCLVSNGSGGGRAVASPSSATMSSNDGESREKKRSHKSHHHHNSEREHKSHHHHSSSGGSSSRKRRDDDENSDDRSKLFEAPVQSSRREEVSPSTHQKSNSNREAYDPYGDQYTPNPTVPTEIPPGYQVKVQCSFHGLTTQIRIASSLSKIALGDKKGNVALLDIITGRVLLHKDLTDGIRSAVVWLCFDDRAVVQKKNVNQRSSKVPGIQKTKKQTFVEPGLFVGLEDGRVFYIALKTGKVDAITMKSEHAGASSLSTILLVDGTGAPVIPAAVPWEQVNRMGQLHLSQGSEEPEEPTELVIRNLDEERKKSKKEVKGRDSEENSIQGPISVYDRKYMIVCSGKMISIYSLPSYKLYSCFTCKDTPATANVVQREGENYCLVVFLSSGDLQVLTLMDLSEIKDMPQALQTIGVQFNPRQLMHDVNCTSDGRFVVLSKYQEVIRGSLFSDENLLGLPYSLPRLFVPNTPTPDGEHQLALNFGQTNFTGMFGNCKAQLSEKEKQEYASQPKKSVQQAQPQRSHTGHPSHQGLTPLQQQQQMRQNPQYSLGEKVLRGAGNTINDVKDIMAQNFEALSVRGQKLEELLVATNELETRSGVFADLAGQLAEKEKKKSWWQ